MWSVQVVNMLHSVNSSDPVRGARRYMTSQKKGGKTMKAIRFEQYGEPAQVLMVQQCPLPEPGKGKCAYECWPVRSTLGSVVCTRALCRG